MDIASEEDDPFHVTNSAEKFLKGFPLKIPRLAIVRIIIFDAQPAPILDSLHKSHTEHGTSRNNDGNICILTLSCDYLILYSIRGQQSWKFVRGSIVTVGASIHYNHLVARSRKCVVPGDCNG